MAARIPRITTTISTSTSVNPLRRDEAGGFDFLIRVPTNIEQLPIWFRVEFQRMSDGLQKMMLLTPCGHYETYVSLLNCQVYQCKNL